MDREVKGREEGKDEGRAGGWERRGEGERGGG